MTMRPPQVPQPEAALAPLHAIWLERFKGLPWSCDQQVPGVVDEDEWRDWDTRDTTPDQVRIEDYIDRYRLSGKRIFHVGIGNSKLAARFIRRGATVVGTTISPTELALAAQLRLAGYEPRLENKHDAAAGPDEGRIDFLVDNNPTTFCCCMEHLGSMLATYRNLLAPGGQIVTDRVGLGWTTSAPGANPRWGFDFCDFEAVGRAFDLVANRHDDCIYVLSRRLPPAPGPVWLARYHVVRALTRIGRRLRLLLPV